MSDTEKRLSALELSAQLDAIEFMTDAELKSFIDGDPVVRDLLADLPGDDLEQIAGGDKKSINAFEKLVRLARRAA